MDYVNASLVSSKLFPFPCRSYIAAQAPLPAYVSDFWHLIWERGVQLLVMLTREKEKWKDDSLVRKADRYWPEEEEGEVRIGQLRVECLSTQRQTEALGLITRRFRVRLHSGGDEGEEREVVHLHFVGWPDHGVPPHVAHFADFVDTYRQLRDAGGAAGGGGRSESDVDSDSSAKPPHSSSSTALSSSTAASSSLAPILVHCSAGIGRTGTFIAIDLLLDEIRHCGLSGAAGISPLNTVRLLRTSRPGMVQTKGQYQFIFQLIDHSITQHLTQAAAHSHTAIIDTTPAATASPHPNNHHSSSSCSPPSSHSPNAAELPEEEPVAAQPSEARTGG